MSKINETRHISQDENCKCKYRLVASFCNNNHNSFLKGWDPGFSLRTPPPPPPPLSGYPPLFEANLENYLSTF